MLSDGMNVEPEYQVQVLQNKIAQMAVREAMLEAAVQQLIAEKRTLRAALDMANSAEAEEVEQEG